MWRSWETLIKNSDFDTGFSYQRKNRQIEDFKEKSISVDFLILILFNN